MTLTRRLEELRHTHAATQSRLTNLITENEVKISAVNKAEAIINRLRADRTSMAREIDDLRVKLAHAEADALSGGHRGRRGAPSYSAPPPGWVPPVQSS